MNVKKLREDFPILKNKFSGKPIIYLDSACMSLKPIQVIEKMNEYYNEYPGCGQRSMHKFGKRVTEEVEKARRTAQKFFNSRKSEEIIFTKNTTEAINIVSNSIGLKKGDVVITTDKEHNSNLVPWQILKERGVKHEIVKFGDAEELRNKMSKNVRLVSMAHTSNLDGTSIPAEEIIDIAHDFGALVMLDAAQSAPHKEVGVKKMDVDFLACSGHKMLGPSGTGILYGRLDLLEKMSPFIVGGETVVETTYTTSEFENPPFKFEPGLQNYSGITGFGEAMNYLMKVGRKNIQDHEKKLNRAVTEKLGAMDEISILGPKNPDLRSGIFSFNIKGVDLHEVALMLDSSANIMMRSGAHCVHSWFNANKLKGSARASFYLYNTEEEADIFADEIKKIIKFLN